MRENWGASPAKVFSPMSDLNPSQFVTTQILRIASSDPSRTALVAQDGKWSFGDLASEMLLISAQLGDLLGSKNELIGLIPGRSADSIAALLGIMHSGRPCLLIDSRWPAPRVMASLAEQRCSVVWDGGFIDHNDEVNEQPASVPLGCLSYVLYTSGSTGSPKAVAVPEPALAHYVAAATHYLALTPDDTVAWQSTLSFDAAFEEILPALTVGASVAIVADESFDPDEMMLRCKLLGVTVLPLPAGVINSFPSQIWQGIDQTRLRLVVSGGSALLRESGSAVGLVDSSCLGFSGRVSGL